MISINNELCNRCGKCQRVCPAFIPVVEQDRLPRVRYAEVCIGCGHCVDVCPTGAFLNDKFPEHTIHTINREILPSPESLMELIRARRSNRTITTKPIPQHSLDMILEAARYAPTAQNSRQVQLHLITDDDALYRVEEATIGYFMRLARVLLSPPIKWIAKLFLGKLYDEVPALYAMNEQFKQGKRPTICNSTALLVISAPKGYDFGMQDCNLAYQNASLMAESLGVSQVYMGFVQVGMFMMGVKKASRILGIPRNHKAFAIMGLGMPAFKYQKYTNRYPPPKKKIPIDMKKHFLFSLFFFLCLAIVPMAHSVAFAGSAKKNPRAVVDLVNRIGGKGTSKKFTFILDPSINTEAEAFVIGADKGKVLIKGSTISALTTGLGWYLNYHANINISWNSLNEKTAQGGAYADLSNIPVPTSEDIHECNAKYRYFFNYCTFGYSMTSWTWNRWQQEIDWMALHGINMPLQIVGLEEVWRKFLTMEQKGKRKYNYTDQEAKAFVPGPAFTAWWGMNNLEGWGGTTSGELNGGTWEGAGGVQDDAWYKRQTTLAKSIVNRQRELGMQPVLPGFSGMVPTNFTQKTGVATDANGGKWAGGFQRPRIIDPTANRFAEIAQDYYSCLEEVMGESQYYSMDPFHEGGSISSGKYSEAYYAIYQAMEEAKSGSQWVIQQWQWDGNQKRSINAVPAGRLIVLDLFSDGKPAFDYYNGYAPQDAVFCAIPNFGGRSGLMGRLNNITDNYFAYTAKYASIKGIGAAPEAIEQTPVTYDLIFQLPWMERKPDMAQWIKQYATARYGANNSVVQNAWELLRLGVLNYGADAIQGPVEDVWGARPNLNARPASTWGKTLNHASGTYTKERRQMLIHATFQLLSQHQELKLKNGSVYESNYHYDLVELGGGVMADYAYDLLLGIKRAKDAAGNDFPNDTTYITRRDAFLALIADVDKFKGTNLNFRLGKWTQEARDAALEVKGATTATPDWYEFNNARTLLTTWSSPNTNLNDYSYRSWQGLMKDVYLPRWQHFFDNKCTAANYGFFEWNWAHGKEHYVGQAEKSNINLTEGQPGYRYSRDPKGNTVLEAKKLLGKYIIPIKFGNSTYYAYRHLENQFQDKLIIPTKTGSSINLTPIFGADPETSITSEVLVGNSLSAVQIKLGTPAGPYPAVITLPDATQIVIQLYCY